MPALRGDPLDEVAAFKAFNPAFPGLLGRDEGQLSDAQMKAFTDFVLQVVYPPNPSRSLDNSLRTDTDLSKTRTSADRCSSECLDPIPGDARAATSWTGLKASSAPTGSRASKARCRSSRSPHLRNMYQKVGMFGMAPDSLFDAE